VPAKVELQAGTSVASVQLIEVNMTARPVVWVLTILAVLFVVVPLLAMLSMAACCGGGMMGMGGGMMGMPVLGFVGMLLAIAVVIGLIVIAVRSVSRV
jgi:hypothetical protein